MQFRSSLPEVTKNLIAINVLMLVATMLLRSKIDLVHHLALFNYKSEFFQPWQIITHMFMHDGIRHLLFNMLALFFVGSRLEQEWGAKKYLNFYLITGLGAVLLHGLVQNYEITHDLIGVNSYSLGASGAIYGLLVAYGLYWPNTEFHIYGIIPVKVKYIVIFSIAVALFSGVTGVKDGVGHFAHLGGALLGFILVKFWNKNNRNSFY
ncbi:MAG: rhomboid family intramembrane serine protease [Bacteroidetes bacterium]|nr:MAG: rhomboid family intramembrane serine protease [Bacteroidota bacterium]